jgi:hypothetical protein
MDTENRTHKIICHDCGGNGYRKDCYGEVYQCKECKSQGEITFTEEEMLENIDDAGIICMTQTVINIVYAEITAIVVMCIVVYLMYLNRK